jgi:hypothetical protein
MKKAPKPDFVINRYHRPRVSDGTLLWCAVAWFAAAAGVAAWWLW